MDYIALYRKWRPMTFDEVVEQNSVVTILKNTVRSGRIAHAYLFCGTRGTGKTSIAKIFSRAVNCLSPQDGNPCNQCEICRGIIDGSLLDVSEIDAASNSGVENVRSIIDESSYQATRAEYKVFIIDEVHNLSTPAFNALLMSLMGPTFVPEMPLGVWFFPAVVVAGFLWAFFTVRAEYSPKLVKRVSFLEFSASVFMVVIAMLYMFTDWI